MIAVIFEAIPAIGKKEDYLGIAAQGRGPKLVFLRALTTLVAAAQAAFDANAATAPPGSNPADPYMTTKDALNLLVRHAAPAPSAFLNLRVNEAFGNLPAADPQYYFNGNAAPWAWTL